MQRRLALSALLLAALACGAAADRRLLQANATAAAAATPGPIKPRQDYNSIADKGYVDLAHGWYDAQCQGAANDYCRFVGDRPNIWWSCALAGSSEQGTAQGVYTLSKMRPQGMPCNTAPKPRRDLNTIADKGYGDMPHGWYDAQCQGVANDYCRYIGDHPNVWWSCALAGAADAYTPQGMFIQHTMEPDTPCQGNPIKPRVDVTTLKYPGTDGGWFDISMQGAANDYCRTVPAEAAGSPDQTQPFWSCALAGAEEITPPGMVQRPATPEDSAGAATPRRSYTTGVAAELAGIMYETDYAPGVAGVNQPAASMLDCCRACAQSSSCSFFVFSRTGDNACVLKSVVPNVGFAPAPTWNVGTWVQCAHEV